jgi:tetrapyrrole methylase family protein/MazG family protein
MGKITIIGLGPGGIDDISLGAIDKLKNSSNIYLRTEIHPIVPVLKEMSINFKSFDWVYEEHKDFQEVYKQITEELIMRARNEGDIVYGVPGHPLVAEETVERIMKISNKRAIEVEVIPSMSFIDRLINVLGIDPIMGLKIVDGLQIITQGCDIKVGNIITQVYSPLIASEVKLQLMEYYKDETPIWVIRAAGVKDREKIEKVPRYELDRLSWIDHLTSVYIPPMDLKHLSGGQIDRLVAIMDTLRSEKGCPWDRKQDHSSLKENLIEEAYEVIDAIENQSMEDLEEELGDVLLQVVFHSQIAKENGFFNFNDVVRNICDKLVYRHPHIFSNVKATTSEEVLTNWEKLKKIEKGMTSQTEVLRSIPPSLPALMRAYKVQKKAGDVGFDWPEIENVMGKVEEEWNELLEVYYSAEKGKIVEELGDLLFSIVNISRFLKIQPELALGQAIEKFIERFSYIEKNTDKNFEEMTLEEMDRLWEQSKIHNFNKNNKNY